MIKMEYLSQNITQFLYQNPKSTFRFRSPTDRFQSIPKFLCSALLLLHDIINGGLAHDIECFKKYLKTRYRTRNLQSCGFYSISKMREVKVKASPREFINEEEEEEGNEISSSLSSVKSTPEIEKKYVHRVYDAIAPHFSSTRFAKWPKVAAFLESLPCGSVILDAGCGNGKYLGLNPSCFFIGCDISHPLIKICSDKGQEVLVADAVNLPYREEFGDAAISIAVLHHLSTENRRKKAIEELVRVVKPGGFVLITVWAAEQEDTTLLNKWTPLSPKYVEEWVGPGSPMNSPRVRNNPFFSLESIPEIEVSTKDQKVENNPSFGLECIPESEESTREQKPESIIPESKDSKEEEKDEKSVKESLEALKKNQQEYFVPWHLPYHRAEVSGASASALASGLAKKDDRKGAVVYNRYYHVFSEGELESLASGVGNAMIVDRFYDKSNWCIVLQKAS